MEAPARCFGWSACSATRKIPPCRHTRLRQSWSRLLQDPTRPLCSAPVRWEVSTRAATQSSLPSRHLSGTPQMQNGSIELGGLISSQSDLWRYPQEASFALRTLGVSDPHLPPAV